MSINHNKRRTARNWLTVFKSGPQRLPLVLQLVGLIIVVALLTGSVVGYVLTNTSRNALRQDALEANLAHAQLAAQFASNYITAVQAHIRVFASRPDVHQAVLANTPEKLQPTLAQFVEIQTALTGSAIYDVKGIQLVHSTAGVTTIGQSFADRDYYQQVMATRQPYLGAPTLSRATGSATMAYAVPIFDDSGQIHSILTGGISLAAFSSAITSVDYGKETRITMIDTRAGGSIIADNNPELLLTQPSANNPAVQQLLADKSGSIEFADDAGSAKLVGFTAVPGFPWGVLVTTPQNVALATVNTLNQQAGLYTSVIVLCAALFGALWMIGLTRPIIRLRDTSLKVAAGDFSQRVRLKQRDEIGELGLAFDHMAQELSDKDTILRSHALDLEKRISERTVELKEAQVHLQTLFNHQETILAAVPDIIMEVDNNKVYTWANQAGLDFFGDDVVGREASYYFEGEQETYQAVKPVFNGTAGTIYVESWQRRKDGQKRLLAWYCRSLHDSEGKIFGALSAATDITERKLAEEEVHNMNTVLEERVRGRTAALQAANNELESFSYSVSHDLRAPLRGIDGWSQALMEEADAKLNATEKQYLKRVRSETQRLGELIEALLQLARISRAQLNKQTLNLSVLTEKILGGLKEKYPDRNVAILIQPGLTADADATLLEVALTNLLDNAWKFSGTREHARIEFGTLEQDQKRVYYVRDNGVGFDMHYIDKLFGAFQRLHKTAEFPGHGIGLATVQRIVHLHGGSIWAEAQVNSGATFYFTL
jgi:PAS domain S-box-containing protein